MAAFDSTCPLCYSASKFEASDYGRRKQFDCPTCTSFDIDASVEELVRGFGPEMRGKLSAAARAGGLEPYLIREPTEGELRRDPKLTVIARERSSRH